MAINTTVENINNQPTIQPRTVTGIFTKYIAKTLPLAFDESMSYYECICALLEYLNETIVPDINNTNDGLSELQTFYLDLQEYVNTYFDNLDVQEEINNKLDAMTESGELTTLIGAYVDPIYEAYETEINAKLDEQDEQIENQTNRITNQNTEINVLKGRMDSFSALTDGSTSGDAELADIRVDLTGQSYSTAGDATRGQADYLNDKINDIESYFKNQYVEGILANGTIQNNGNQTAVHTTNYVPINGGGYLYIYVDSSLLQENEIFVYGWSLFNSEKVALQHNTYASANTDNVIHVSNGASIKYVDVVIAVYNTSTETYRNVRKTDFAPNQVQIKTSSKYFESLETAIASNTTNLNNKLDNTKTSQQCYLMKDDDYIFEVSGTDVYFHYSSMMVFRVNYSNQWSCADMSTMVGETYSGTSPSGVENCIILPEAYDLVLDYNDSSQRIKVLPRTDVANSNNYFRILESLGGEIVGGHLMYLFNNQKLKVNQVFDIYNIPDYWKSSLNTAINKVRTNVATINSKLESFFFITDQHWSSNAQKSSDLMKYLGNKLQIPLVLSGGDVLNANVSTKLRAINEMSDYVASLDNGFIRLFGTYGNHDNNNNINSNPGNVLTTQQEYNAMLKQRESFTFDSTNIKVMKYDNTDSHIRYISFKCSWEYGETADDDMINQVLSYISELDSTWSVVLFCHTYWRTSELPYTIADYYVDKIATLEHTCDASIVALFVGHVHNDYYTTYSASNGGKLLIISTTTDSFRQNNLGQNPPYTMTEGTDTEQAFDIVQIDTTSKHIYLTRVGAGNNRDFTY